MFAMMFAIFSCADSFQRSPQKYVCRPSTQIWLRKILNTYQLPKGSQVLLSQLINVLKGVCHLREVLKTYNVLQVSHLRKVDLPTAHGVAHHRDGSRSFKSHTSGLQREVFEDLPIAHAVSLLRDSLNDMETYQLPIKDQPKSHIFVYFLTFFNTLSFLIHILIQKGSTSFKPKRFTSNCFGSFI